MPAVPWAKNSGVFQTLAVAGQQHQVGAAAGELPGEGGADPRAGAGDQRQFSFHCFHALKSISLRRTKVSGRGMS